MTRYASIDAGTNSTRLLLAEVAGTRDRPLLRTLERRMAITRMGKGVDAEGRLSEAGLERTRRVLEDYARVIREQGGVRRLEVAGTSAARDASNASAFTDIVLKILGVRPRVLSGEEEARLSFTGATYDLPQALEAREKQAPILVVDIGGGSTEFVLGQGAGQLYRRSVDVGCVRMSERFLASDPPRAEEIAAMREAVQAALAPVLEELQGMESVLLIGLAGTVTTLSAMRMRLSRYDGERIHGSRLTRDEVSVMFREMAALNLEERKAYMGLEPERADVILGGNAVLECVLTGLGLDELLVSEKDILDGLVIEAWSEGLDPL
jgi:exopolyphosphatase/guanosine-5'-triphosphate,3'-diphosphate pyrophosphatase